MAGQEPQARSGWSGTAGQEWLARLETLEIPLGQGVISSLDTLTVGTGACLPLAPTTCAIRLSALCDLVPMPVRSGAIGIALAMGGHPPANISFHSLAVRTHRSTPSGPLVGEVDGMEGLQLSWQRGVSTFCTSVDKTKTSARFRN